MKKMKTIETEKKKITNRFVALKQQIIDLNQKKLSSNKRNDIDFERLIKRVEQCFTENKEMLDNS